MPVARRAGTRRHWVALQSIPTTTPTSTGFSGTWTTYASVWASVSPAGQQERIAAMSTEAPITHLVEMDYMAGVRADHRVLMPEGQALYLAGKPENVEMRNQTLVLRCEERDE